MLNFISEKLEQNENFETCAKAPFFFHWKEQFLHIHIHIHIYTNFSLVENDWETKYL